LVNSALICLLLATQILRK